MNPYAQQLGNRDALQVISETTTKLSALLDGLGPGAAELPIAAGKWNPRQILCHLADCELVFSVRLRQTLAEPHHIIQPFDQDLWAQSYDAYPDARMALKVFSAARQWNIALLGSVPPRSFDRPVTHPERGAMTFRTIVETMAGHDLNHLAQLEGLRTASAGA